MYSSNAKIIRVVLKKDGTTVTRQTNTQRYISEMKKSQTIAKVRKYKNYYTNVTVTQTGTDTYKISSYRQPSGESYKLKAYMVVQKQSSGKWLIIEEMMQTKVQMLATAK
jgi:ligand-binding sensor protein